MDDTALASLIAGEDAFSAPAERCGNGELSGTQGGRDDGTSGNRQMIKQPAVMQNAEANPPLTIKSKDRSDYEKQLEKLKSTLELYRDE